MIMTINEIEQELCKIYDALEALNLDVSVLNYVQDELDKYVEPDTDTTETEQDSARAVYMGSR